MRKKIEGRTLKAGLTKKIMVCHQSPPEISSSDFWKKYLMMKIWCLNKNAAA